ncbi:RraA family protein [Pelagibius marinus]|uniref:RraA family protein n=1 Tax=Pelagibius marinus TaxID=2762760 RepID=UPI001872A74D|nr:RraA family protein [Pelagibius marinus]
MSLDFLSGVSAASAYEANAKRGAAGPGIRAMVENLEPVCGRAYTVRCWPGDAKGLWQALAVAPTGSIVVADMGGAAEITALGSGTAKAALARGIAGLVVNAAVRDIRELRRLKLPIFAMGISVRGTHKCHDGQTEVAISIGLALCETGNIVVADDDGVVVVSAAEEAAFRQRLPGQLAKEAEIDRRLAEGESPDSVLGLR